MPHHRFYLILRVSPSPSPRISVPATPAHGLTCVYFSVYRRKVDPSEMEEATVCENVSELDRKMLNKGAMKSSGIVHESRSILAAASPLKALIFDCDGVLVDTEPLHYRAFQEVLGPLGLGHSYEHYLQRYIGFDDRDAFLEAFKEGGRTIDDMILAQLIRAKERILQQMIVRGISSFPGVVALVRDLAAHRVPLAVASGALRHEVEAFLKGLGLAEHFPVIVAANDVTRSKPDPETYLKALSRLQETIGGKALEPRSCIAIEDTPAGIRAAKDAGLYGIGVTNSFASDELDTADHIVVSLEDLNTSRLVQLVDEQSSPQ